jgi:hypothetical protein
MTETPAMTDWQIEERLLEIAPPPDPDAGVTADGLARYLAVRAQLGFTRNVTPFIRDDQQVSAWQICLEFAAAHLLFTLQGEVPDLADMVAQHIAQSWEDGEIGEWLHEYLAAAGVDPSEVARLDEARLALEKSAGQATP